MNYFEKIGTECFNHLKQLNPKGGIRTFIRMAVEYGYKQALEDYQQFKVGSKVTYKSGIKPERGIIKSFSIDRKAAFVVYNCNNDWVNYDNYTAASTNFRDLVPGWFEEKEYKQQQS